MKRKSIIVITAFLGICLFTGCQQEKETVDNEVPGKEIADSEELETEIVTDFYEMVNQEWLEENKDHSGFYYGATEEQKNKVDKALDDYLIELTNKKAVQPESLTKTEEKAVILYEQATNMEQRNELGTKPIEEMLAKVEQIADYEDFITLYQDEKMSYYHTLFAFDVNKYPADGTYQVRLYPKTICGQYGMLTQEQLTGYEFLIKQLMMFSGYEEARASQIAKNAVAVECKIFELNFDQMQNFSSYGEKELTYLLSNMPVMEIAREQGYLDDRNSLLCDARHLELLQELFVEENTDMVKDYFLASIVVKSAPYLSEEMAQYYGEAVNALMGAGEKEENPYEGCQMVSLVMEDFLAEYYMNQYVGEEMEQEVKSLTEEIRGELKQKITDSDWMSEQTKEYALNKLEHMQLIVGIPEKVHDYSKLTVLSYEEGGTLLDNILNAYVFDCDFKKEFLKEECENVYYFHALNVNATYAMTYNAFAVNAGIITLDGCSHDSSYEEKLAILGFIIAHEISHGFDGNGSNYTIEGKYQDWWTIEDKMAYRERINEVKHYFDGMEVKENLTLVGENVMNESYSDLSAMSVCMDLLEKRENSDYKLFFETYGKVERVAITDEFLTYLTSYDSHLPSKIRVNHIVNQMDEFYEVYEVPKDCAMYVPEEERLKVWE